MIGGLFARQKVSLLSSRLFVLSFCPAVLFSICRPCLPSYHFPTSLAVSLLWLTLSLLLAAVCLDGCFAAILIVPTSFKSNRYTARCRMLLNVGQLVSCLSPSMYSPPLSAPTRQALARSLQCLTVKHFHHSMREFDEYLPTTAAVGSVVISR